VQHHAHDIFSCIAFCKLYSELLPKLHNTFPPPFPASVAEWYRLATRWEKRVYIRGLVPTSLSNMLRQHPSFGDTPRCERPQLIFEVFKERVPAFLDWTGDAIDLIACCVPPAYNIHVKGDDVWGPSAPPPVQSSNRAYVRPPLPTGIFLDPRPKKKRKKTGTPVVSIPNMGPGISAQTVPQIRQRQS
jgi:hypothetical protein